MFCIFFFSSYFYNYVTMLKSKEPRQAGGSGKILRQSIALVPMFATKSAHWLAFLWVSANETIQSLEMNYLILSIIPIYLRGTNTGSLILFIIQSLRGWFVREKIARRMKEKTKLVWEKHISCLSLKSFLTM
jgi:hypothetical protein